MKNLIKELVKNKFFKVTFTKKNGELREMIARLGVKKHLKGGQLSYNADDFNYITAYDIAKKGYRTINVDTIKEIKINKKTYTF